MYLVQHFYKQHGKALGLDLLAGLAGLQRRIKKAEVQRPGLSLAGYMKGFVPSRMLVLGRQEIEYLRELDAAARKSRLSSIVSPATPAIILAKGCSPPKELLTLVEEKKIALFKAASNATDLISHITFLLFEEFSPSMTLHGTLVEVFGVG